jgi:hypothetical protein
VVWHAVQHRRPDRLAGPDVLDVYTTDGAPGFASYNRLKRAGLLAGGHRLVRTRSGGLHVYYAGTARGCGRLRAERDRLPGPRRVRAGGAVPRRQ